jgi:sugar phosphate isomerase/epimerase
MTLFAGLSLSPFLRAAAIDSVAGGVPLGVQTFSFHEVTHGGMDSVDKIVADMSAIGLGMCELYSCDIESGSPPTYAYQPGAKFEHTEPPAAGDSGTVNPADAAARSAVAAKERENLRQWRLSTPLSYFSGVRKKFSDAGIQIYCYNYSFDDSFSDEEMDRGFEMAKALGANFITASATLSVLKRLAPVAEKHRMAVAMHGLANVKDTNHFSSPETFAVALGMSNYFKVNLDIGHFWVAGFDPVSYIEQQHANITNIHIKDRLRSGEDVPWGGEGPDHTPLREVLLLLKKNRWAIPVMIEYEYRGPGTSREEVAKCYATARKILES